jgi:purine nucleoside phosphorylase
MFSLKIMNIGIIGGSGANEVIAALGVEAIRYESPKENICGVDYIQFDYEGNKVIFVQRHGAHHTRDPARLDPRYIVETLEGLMGKDDSNRLIIQTSASGCLDPYDKEANIGTKLVDEGGIVVCHDVMRSFGFGAYSFSGEGGRELHAVIQNAYSETARRLALDAIAKVPGATGYEGGVYVNTAGNQFESPAEVMTLWAGLELQRILFKTLRGDLRRTRKELESETPGSERYKELKDEEAEYLRDIPRWEKAAKVLNINHSTVSMNAAKELPLLVECSFKNIVLLSLPVNYGVGMIPDEKVDHERTKQAIAKAAPLYIAPTLINMIRMAEQYIRR